MYFLRIGTNSSQEAVALVQAANTHARNLFIHNENSSEIVDAKSLMGVMYARFKFNKMYLASQYGIPHDMFRFRSYD